jgi:hypothetical protein
MLGDWKRSHQVLSGCSLLSGYGGDFSAPIPPPRPSTGLWKTPAGRL